MTIRRILIVDDEPFIVNGLAGMIKEAELPESEVYKASSAAEALSWLERTAMDIVLTDICMPGMDGLELQRRILQRWPRCKIVFLTGHNDFNYAKEAIHHRAVDYILKTEGDAAILAAVRKARAELEREFEMGTQLEKAQAQIQSALPLLQKEFLLDLFRGDLHPTMRLQERLDELDMPFSTSAPVLLLVGKVDEWADRNASDQTLLLYAIQNIAEEYLSPAARTLSFAYDKNRIAWLIQAPDDQEREGSSLALYVRGMAEKIQTTCGELLRLKLSFASASELVPWSFIAERFEGLNRSLRRSFAMGQQLLLTDDQPEPEAAESASRDSATKWIRKQAVQLEACLENGQQTEFQAKLTEWLRHETIGSEPELRLVASCQLLATFLAFASAEGALKELSERIDPDKLLKAHTRESWEEEILRLAELADSVFVRQEGMNRQHGRSVVATIHQYVADNLGGDLSLTRIGEVVALNPAYLSRLYKQLTGNGLSETITEARLAEAKRLLEETNEKAQDVAIKVGFESAAYFTRLFKKMTERTPQEYREFSRKPR